MNPITQTERVICPICGRYIRIYGTGSLAKHAASKTKGKSIPCAASQQSYAWVRQQQVAKKWNEEVRP